MINRTKKIKIKKGKNKENIFMSQTIELSKVLGNLY